RRRSLTRTAAERVKTKASGERKRSRLGWGRMRRRGIGMLATAHLFDDLNQGVIPALLPFFIAERGFTIAAAAGLVFASNVSSSVLQPLFGLLADRRSTPWLVPAGLLLAGTGVALAGLAPTYALVLGAAAATGV